MPGLRWLAALGACFALSVSAQTTPVPTGASAPSAQREPEQPPSLIPRSHEERERRFQMEHRIILNVQVTDPSGNPVRKLDAKDFTLLQDRQPHALVSFRTVDGPNASAPTHVIVLLDGVNDSSRDIVKDRKEIERYLRNSQPPLRYPISITVLSESGATAGQPSRDRDVLLGELKNLASHLHPIGCADQEDPNEAFLASWMPAMVGAASRMASDHQLSCLDKRFLLSVTALEKIAHEQANIPGRAILIWVGPGWPLLYNKEFRSDDSGLKRRLFGNLVEVSTALREAQVTLDMVSPPDQFRRTPALNDHDRSFLNGVPNEKEVTSGSLSLQALAHQSGGQVPIENKDIPEGIAACIADGESYYVLSFDSAPAAGPDEYHALEVKVDDARLKVRTNTTFYAEQ
jgi:VWFA-related protein